MHTSVLLLVGSLFYIVLIAILYFSRKRLDSLENKIYKYLICVSIFGIIMDLIGIYVSINVPDTNIIRLIVLKLYYSYLLSITFLITAYMFLPILDSSTIKFRRRLYLIVSFYIISMIINLLLPFTFYHDGNIIYATGLNPMFLYLIVGISMIIWSLYIIVNFKTIKKKRNLPIITFVLLSAPIIYIQMSNPELLLVTALATFIVILMYHTIENPDLKMLHEMELAKDEAEKANKHKSDFLSSMSHEIRTPLNAIVGLSEVNANEATQVDEIRENSKNILNASNILVEIVGNVLDMSRIESGNIKIVDSDYKPYDVFESVLKVVDYRYKEKKLQLNINIAPDIPKLLYGDHGNIKKVLLNLLTNAVKYTNEGHVDLTINSVNKDDICRLIISVEDTGRGIKPENIDKLFTKFNRLDEDRNTTTEGTGLGLAITKHVIELMGGNITVQSVYGSGSKFTVTLDQRIKKIEPSPTVYQTEAKTNIIQNAINNVQQQQNQEIPIQPTVEQPKQEIVNIPSPSINNISSLSDKKVLIIDDNKLNLKVASKLLSGYGVQVVECNSGQECIDKINNGEKYDLLLADEMMPVMSGTEMMKKLKDNGYQTPIIALTADVENNAKERYMANGFNDYLGKSIKKQELDIIMQKFLK